MNGFMKRFLDGFAAEVMNPRSLSRSPILVVWLALFQLFVLPGESPGQTGDETASASPTIPKLTDANPEIIRLVAEDQWDRGFDMFGGREVKQANPVDWSAITKRDEERQTKVKDLLAKGELKTGRDYHYAALIFQHSASLEHLRLAHVLATTAVAIGYTGARWLSAATLDRYLQTSGQPQIFGTQFRHGPGSAPWTMEPYDKEAITDHIRLQWCVVPLAEQEDIFAGLRSGGPMRPTNTPDCR
jgi:hypothetical protein